MPEYRYGILGAGRQGTAAAFDLIVRGEAASVVLAEFLSSLDAFVSSASYRLNVGVSKAAIDASTHMCDLGGNLEIVRRQLQLDGRARDRGVCIVPDCGEAPGLASNLMAYGLTLLDRTDELVLYDGGLPVDPVPPWNYLLTFNVDGLTNEYDGTTTWWVDGKLVEVNCLDPSEDELVDFEPPLGTLEAFAAA